MSDSGSRILVVDDDPGMRETLADFLELEGYAVDAVGSVTDARAQITSTEPDLILLDLNLGGEDGLGFAAQLRAHMATPIIIISGKGAMVDRVVGLEVGADDYLPKPFELRELLARVRALLRRSRLSRVQEGGGVSAAPAPSPVSATERHARFSGLVFDPLRRRVTAADGHVLDLTGAEFNLLACLIERPNRVLSRDAIADATQRGEPTSFDRSIDTLVSRLRRKLEPHTDAARLIQTVRGEGYVLASAVEWVGPRT